jgi:copper chaperone
MIKLKITGMTCQHCVKAVTKALISVPGTREANVNLELGEAAVDSGADVHALIEAVQEEGYEAEEAKP